MSIGIVLKPTPPGLSRKSAPPNARGFLVGQHGTWIVMGYAIAGWVGAGTYYSSNLSFQWRFPIALSMIFPLALALCAPWIPESPRWCKSALRASDSLQLAHLTQCSQKTDGTRHGRLSNVCMEVQLRTKRHCNMPVKNSTR